MWLFSVHLCPQCPKKKEKNASLIIRGHTFQMFQIVFLLNTIITYNWAFKSLVLINACLFIIWDIVHLSLSQRFLIFHQKTLYLFQIHEVLQLTPLTNRAAKLVRWSVSHSIRPSPLLFGSKQTHLEWGTSQYPQTGSPSPVASWWKTWKCFVC